MRNLRWTLAGGLLAGGLPVACADPCIDDGLGQAGQGRCPTADGSATEGATDSNTNTETVSDSLGTTTMGSNTDGMTGSQSSTETVGETLDGTETVAETDTVGETETVGDTDTDTDTAGGTLWCVDADGDGFGDPDMCQQSDVPVPGSVDNDDDCDDGSENTFPGAAPNDDRSACMQDEDGDDWGDDEPPPGVEPGTDCIDDDVAIFPGAAVNEMPPDLCAQDDDGDGWGDDMPPPGADPGTDCADDDAAIFPGAAVNEMPPDLCAQDGDGDGWGDDMPPPGVEVGTDCDDSNPNIEPGAAPNDDPQACMQDEDGDDWGDDTPPPGVDVGTDCADANASIFPGTAPLDDPAACMQDEDDDDFGDDTPPPGVDVGTDCDDTNVEAFPGAAPNESPPDLCTIDADDDDWGDANPGGGGGGGGGPQSGSDCYDTNVDLNPDTLQLTGITPFNGGPAVPRVLNIVDEANGALAPFVTLLTPAGTIPNANFVTATFNENLEIFAMDLYQAQLYSLDYELTCGGAVGEAAPVGMPFGIGTASGMPNPDIVCGLEFGDNGNLYGVSHNLNELLTFDPVTGQDISSVPITLPAMGGVVLDIFSCGMARDCTAGRLLVANGIDQSIYSINEVTGEALLLRDLEPYLGAGVWNPSGLEYDPVSQMALLSNGTGLYQVDLENDVPPVLLGGFPQAVSNLQYLPVCSP